MRHKFFLFLFAFVALQTTVYGFDLHALVEKIPQVKHFYATNSSASANAPSASLSAQDGFTACQISFYKGNAPIIKNGSNLRPKPICFDGFATLYSTAQKIPVYSAEVLNKEKLSYSNHQERTNQFYEEARLPSVYRATLDDYKGSGFDRGHNFPAGDSSTPEAMAQSFSLANMMPQAPSNNRKLWESYESATRKYVKRAKGDVYIITGSIVDPNNCTIENALSGELPQRYDLKTCTIGNGVAVPVYIYKVVFDPSVNKAWAYWTININSQNVIPPISYAEIVQRTGIDFFPGVVLN